MEALHRDAVATVRIELAGVLSTGHDDEFRCEFFDDGRDQAIESAAIARVAAAEGERDVEIAAEALCFARCASKSVSSKKTTDAGIRQNLAIEQVHGGLDRGLAAEAVKYAVAHSTPDPTIPQHTDSSRPPSHAF